MIPLSLRNVHDNAVEGLRHEHLARKPAVVAAVVEVSEQRLLVVDHGRQLAKPGRFDVAVTRRTQTRATALGLDTRHAVVERAVHDGIPDVCSKCLPAAVRMDEDNPGSFHNCIVTANMASFLESGLVIGLTGGIASGKSTAARYLASLGAHVIDADALGHRAYEPDTDAYRAVLATFGEDVRGPNGQLDRKALGGKVFGDPGAMKRLTDIMWPEIRRLAEVEIGAVRETDASAVVVLEAAVLFEAGWQDAVDETWVVTADRDVALTRAMSRDGLDRSAVQARMDAQLSNEKRARLADVVVDNSGDEDAMRSRLDAEWARVTTPGGHPS